MDTIQHTEHLPVPDHAATGLCSTINRCIALERKHKLHNLFGNADHSAYWAPTCSTGCWYWVVQHYQPQHCFGEKTQTAQSVWQCRSFSMLGTYLFQSRLVVHSTRNLLCTAHADCTICLTMQIIQHAGHLPGSEDADSIKARPSPRVQRQTSDLSALRPKRQDMPQQLQGNVEGILTLQLSHLNVVHTFRAVTIPVQVRHAVTSPYVQEEKEEKEKEKGKRKARKEKKRKEKKRKEKKRKEKKRKEKKRKEKKEGTEKKGKEKKGTKGQTERKREKIHLLDQYDGKPSITPGCPDHHIALLCICFCCHDCLMSCA